MTRNPLLRAFVPLISLATGLPAWAGVNAWTSTGPPGQDIQSIAATPSDPNVIYLGTSAGPNGSGFKSTDDGANWTTLALPSSPPSSAFPVIFGVAPADADSVWLSNSAGVFHSSDGGTTWTSSFFLTAPINVFAFQPDGTIWVGTPNGLSKGLEGGVFHNPGNFPSGYGQNVSAVVFDPANPSTVYACADHLYRSLDDGESWEALDGLLPPAAALAIAIDPSDASHLYLGRADGVYRSTDGGASWDGPETGTAGLPITAIEPDAVSPSVLYAAAPGRGLLASTDSGASWQPNTALCPVGFSIVRLDTSDNTHLIVAGSAGLFDSPDSGASWSLVEAGSPALDVEAIALDPADGSHVYAGTKASGLWESSDGGTTWSSLCDPAVDPRSRSIAVSLSSPSTIYIGTEAGVYKTVNGGANWIPAGLAGDRVSALAVDPADADIVYAGTQGGTDPEVFFRSTNGGASWQPANAGIPSDAIAESIAIDPSDLSTVYFAVKQAYSGVVLKSRDSGAQFSPTALLDLYAMFSVAIDPSNSDVVYAGGGFAAYRTQDGGSTGAPLTPFNVGDVRGLAIDPSAPDTIYLATASGTFKSIDGGSHWLSWPVPTVPGSTIAAIIVDPDVTARLYGGFQRGGAGVLDQVAPTVSSVSPSTGNTVGGLLATIHGTGFMPGLELIFDGAPLTPISVTDTEITIVTPPHPVGSVDIQVIDPTFLQATLASAFEYVCSAPFTAIVQGTRTICPGNNAEIDVYLSGVPPWTLTWHDGEIDQASDSPYRRTVSPDSDTTYFLDSVSDSSGCGAGSPSGSAVITVSTPPPAPVITAPLTVPADATNVAASVPLHPGNDDFWNLSNAWQTGGGITNAITFTPWAPGVTVDLQVSEWDLTGTRCFTATADRLVQVDFLDVPQGAPFHDFIDAIAEHGVTNGCGNGDYCPNRRLARQQMAAFIARSATGTPPDSGMIGGFAYDCVSGPSYFVDVPVGSLFCAAIHYLASQKITIGCSPQHFCPGLVVTREQMALFIGRAIAPSANPPSAYSDGGTGRSYDCSVASPFPDVAPNTESCNAIGYIWAKGIVDGFGDGTFHPNDALTRAPAAKFIANAFGLTLGP